MNERSGTRVLEVGIDFFSFRASYFTGKEG